MEYFRRYLIYIRKLDNTKMKPIFIIRMILIAILGLIGGILADKFMPFNFMYNMIRAIITIITGISSASYALVVSDRLKLNKYRTENNYKPFRKRFSYRQRANISIVLGSIIALFILLSTRNNLVFTLKSSFSLFLVIILIAFARKDRSEFLKDVYDIPDIRDLEFMTKNSRKAKENVSKDNKVKKDSKNNKNIKSKKQ